MSSEAIIISPVNCSTHFSPHLVFSLVLVLGPLPIQISHPKYLQVIKLGSHRLLHLLYSSDKPR
jgi:hypothetical protein